MTDFHITRRSLGGLTLGAFAATLGGRAMAQDPLVVTAVNYPLAYFAERVGGDLAEVIFNIPAEVDPSFWRPGIADITAIQAADVILLNGAGFADWTARTTLPRSRTVLTSAAFEDAFISTATVTHSHGDGGAHSHTGVANYHWLDFAQAHMQAETIAAAVSRRAPENADTFYANLTDLRADLDALAEAAQRIGAAADGMAMIASHPRYQYFARAYGFRIDALDWDPRDTISEDQWAALEALITETGARVFIWEAEPDADALARMEALGLVNAVFPPLANRPASGDFMTSMTDALTALDAAVQSANGA